MQLADLHSPSQTYAISVAPLSEEIKASLYAFGVGPLPGTDLRHPLRKLQLLASPSLTSSDTYTTS